MHQRVACKSSYANFQFLNGTEPKNDITTLASYARHAILLTKSLFPLIYTKSRHDAKEQLLGMDTTRQESYKVFGSVSSMFDLLLLQ